MILRSIGVLWFFIVISFNVEIELFYFKQSSKEECEFMRGEILKEDYLYKSQVSECERIV